MASTTNDHETLYQVRLLRKDIGVALIAAICLLIGFVVFRVVDTRSKSFQTKDIPFTIAYPASWIPVDSLIEQPLMKVEDPTSPSAFKSALTVDTRELDPAAPPTLQLLMDRRVEQRGTLTGYHFLGNKETTVGGEKAMEYDYAYVAQPIDEPRRASLPVVVVAREYIVVSKDRVYYITLAVPEVEQDRIGSKLEQIVNSVRLQ